VSAPVAALAPIVLWGNDASHLADWRAQASAGSRAELALDTGSEGSALRFDFALSGHGAWAIARRELALALPAHWVLVLALRGAGTPAGLQVKLVDERGANVWWWRRALEPASQTRLIVLRRASLEFAWGPRSGGEPERLGALEIAVASDVGSTGTLWIEALRLEPRPPAHGSLQPRAARASSQRPGHDAAYVLDPDSHASWVPDPHDPRPWLEVDLGERRECGGLVLDFAQGAGEPTPETRLLGSDDGELWTPLARDPGGLAGRRWLRTEAEARWLRVELPPGAGGLARVAVAPIELAVSPARYAAARAREAPRGRYPRHLLGEQSPWALVSADGDTQKGLLGEDGALEVGFESFSLEPFLWIDERLHTWADGERRAALADRCLPVPSVAWEAAGLRVRLTAFADGPPGASALVARYAVENPGPAARSARLFLAIRPFQVTPAWQSLNLAGGGGVAPIAHLEQAGGRVRVDGQREVVAVTRADGFGAADAEEGLAALFAGRLPERSRVDDPTGFTEGALAFDLALEPGASREVVVGVPLFDATPELPASLEAGDAAAWAAARYAAVLAGWRERLGSVPISLPASAAPFEESLRAGLAWILTNREGPRIQPGPRCYRRAWIRDGALTGTALAEWGFADEARAFLRWYAPYQHADGRVPCAVDRRGADPVPENDSHGELVWAVVELYRLTGDTAFLAELWPRVARAAGAIAALRAERTGEAWRGTPCFGLLPESISHEGYSSQPVHSYWDDLFGVRGLADAAEAAGVLGDAEAAGRFASLRDAMRHDLHASIAACMEQHGIAFVPGSVELGDFDPTSTAIAIDPCGEARRLPRAALARTFERYWAEFETRRRGESAADAYTPYEIRNATALLYLGWKERALSLLEWMIADQRPPAWRQWPEVATRDPRAPRFLGDLPHGWVASSFARALRRMLAWEDDEAGTLVVAAGIPETWAREAPGVRVRGLPTHFGPLDLVLAPADEAAVRVHVGGACRPPGGAVLVSPLTRPLREIEAGGRTRPAADPHRVVLRELPVDLVLRASSPP